MVQNVSGIIKSRGLTFDHSPMRINSVGWRWSFEPSTAGVSKISHHLTAYDDSSRYFGGEWARSRRAASLCPNRGLPFYNNAPTKTKACSEEYPRHRQIGSSFINLVPPWTLGIRMLALDLNFTNLRSTLINF